MSEPSRPNILLVVLDAVRLDFAKSHAPYLRSLGEEGAWFENAIAPATWSQPSHTSLFVGEDPHEHGVTKPSQSRAPADLVEVLSERGYDTHGVSGNGFTSPLWEFDEPFDTFRYTQTPEPFVSGMDTYTFLQNRREETSKHSLIVETSLACLSHDRPVRSVANLCSVGVNALARNSLGPLTRIPHPIFAPTLPDTYSAEKNTRRIEELIKSGAKSDDPFFVFTNYMDAHRPYTPPPTLQEKHLGEELSKAELHRLNEEVAAPWSFVRLRQEEEVDRDDVEQLRELYAASVEYVDRHLGRLLKTLEEEGVRDETLIVVTADHGENLGETDSMGRCRFGHEASISDVLARVPLVIQHPALDSDDSGEYVSLKDLYTLVTSISDPDTEMRAVNIGDLHSDRVTCQYPALGDSSFYDRYPDIDRSYLQQRVTMDSVAVYEDNWRVVAESDGTRLAERDGQRTDIGEVSGDVLEAAEIVLEELGRMNEDSASAKTSSRLEDLGYL